MANKKKTAPELHVESETEAHIDDQLAELEAELKQEKEQKATQIGETAQTEPASAVHASTDTASKSASETNTSQATATNQSRQRRPFPGLKRYLEELFPGHGNAALFALLGFVCAVAFFVLGFWRTFVICLLVVVGLAIGQVLDGDPVIIKSLSRFWRNRGNK